MPDPRYMIACSVPPIELVNILSSNKQLDTLHLYIDLKNAATALFIPEVVEEIVLNSEAMDLGHDSSIFQSILYVVSNWKKWAHDRNLNIKIFFCSDKGRSTYHKTILNDYKSNRKITNLTLAKYNEPMQKIKEANFNFAETICNKLKDVYFLSLDFIEGDFLSYYLITRFYKEQNNILHIIASNDKDHHQTLCQPNTVMFTKKYREVKFWDKNNILAYFSDIDKQTDPNKQNELLNKMSKIDPAYSSIMLSFCGDSCDNIPGVSGIGPKRALEMFSDETYITNFIGNLEEAIERVHNDGLLLKEDNEIIRNLNILQQNNTQPIAKKKIVKDKMLELWKKSLEYNETVTKAFKVINYELLSKWLEKEDNTNKIKNLQYIKNVLNKVNIDIVNSDTKNQFAELIKKIKDNQMSDNVINNLFL